MDPMKSSGDQRLLEAASDEQNLLWSSGGGHSFTLQAMGEGAGITGARIVSLSELSKMGIVLSEVDLARLNIDVQGQSSEPTVIISDIGSLEDVPAEIVDAATTGAALHLPQTGISPHPQQGLESTTPQSWGQSGSDLKVQAQSRPADSEYAAASADGTQLARGVAVVNSNGHVKATSTQVERGVAVANGNGHGHMGAASTGPTLMELSGQSLPFTLDLNAASNNNEPENDNFINRVHDRTFPAIVQEEIFAVFRSSTAVQYDALWRCSSGATFKVHRLVLAMGSPFLRDILLQESGDSTPVIDTPDFSSEIIKAVICLFYSGRVTVTNRAMADLTTALKLLGFTGEISSVIPNLPDTEGEEVERLIPDSVTDFCQVEMNGTMGSELAKNKKRKSRCHGYDSDDSFVVGDSAYDDDLIAAGSEDDDWTPARLKRRLQEEEDSEEEGEGPSKFASTTRVGGGLRRGRKSLKTPDTRELFRTRGSGKGDRSYRLAAELFDGRHSDFVYACRACYSCFDTEKRYAVHKDDAHPEGVSDGSCHTDNPHEFRCPTCQQTITVKHLVWFCKHVKYCGTDDVRAQAIVGPDEEASELDDEETGGASGGQSRKYSRRGGGEHYRDNAERLRITGVQKGKNLQTLSLTLVGKVVDYIWGCRTCYTVFLSESDLVSHRQEKHEGRDEPGNCWNAATENYTCLHCDQRQNCRHLVWFIYHMRKCSTSLADTVALAAPQYVKRENCEDYDTDQDENRTNNEGLDDDSDPSSAIVYKPFRISSEQAEWICQSLLGRAVDRLYPCHVCYVVFEMPGELEAHFRTSHPLDMRNRIENGAHYRKQEQAFSCPVCLKLVCRRMSTSVFFTYHLRKCFGHTFQLQRTCPDCGKEFTSYSAYRQHSENTCERKLRACHLCGKTFICIARLNTHVQYVHSSIKPYPCTTCGKSYKRKAELQEHQEMAHSTHFNYSCEKCGKQFYGKKNLALHMKTHFSEEEKKHVCSLCGYRFAKIKFLKNHITTHSDVRQFSCEVCGARVKTRDTLKQHRKKLHNLTTPIPQTALFLDPVTGLQQTILIKDEGGSATAAAAATTHLGLGQQHSPTIPQIS